MSRTTATLRALSERRRRKQLREQETRDVLNAVSTGLEIALVLDDVFGVAGNELPAIPDSFEGFDGGGDSFDGGGASGDW